MDASPVEEVTEVGPSLTPEKADPEGVAIVKADTEAQTLCPFEHVPHLVIRESTPQRNFDVNSVRFIISSDLRVDNKRPRLETHSAVSEVFKRQRENLYPSLVPAVIGGRLADIDWVRSRHRVWSVWCRLSCIEGDQLGDADNQLRAIRDNQRPVGGPPLGQRNQDVNERQDGHDELETGQAKKQFLLGGFLFLLGVVVFSRAYDLLWGGEWLGRLAGIAGWLLFICSLLLLGSGWLLWWVLLTPQPWLWH